MADLDETQIELINKVDFEYDTYNSIAYVIPLVLLGISFIGLLIAVYVIILVSWPLKKKIEHFADKHHLIPAVEKEENKIPCWTFIIGGLKLIYGHQISECRHPSNMNVYIICGRHVRPWLLVVLFLVVVFVCTCTVVAFWCEFLITESDRCNSQMDCFALDTNYKPVEKNPLKNCTEYENGNYTIHCFRFIFNYADALGDAGGVLVLATVIMNIQAGLWIGASSQKRKGTWCLAIVGVTILNIIVEAVLIALPVLVIYVPLLKSRVNTDRKTVQFYTYWATFICAFTISGPIFIIFSRRLRNQTAIDGEEQYVSVTSKRIRMSNSAANTDSESGEDLDVSDTHKQNKSYGTV